MNAFEIIKLLNCSSSCLWVSVIPYKDLSKLVLAFCVRIDSITINHIYTFYILYHDTLVQNKINKYEHLYNYTIYDMLVYDR